MAKKEIEFTDCQTAFEWHAVEGDLGRLTEKILSIDLETGDITRLLRFPEGYERQRGIMPSFWEEIYILERISNRCQGETNLSKGMLWPVDLLE